MNLLLLILALASPPVLPQVTAASVPMQPAESVTLVVLGKLLP